MQIAQSCVTCGNKDLITSPAVLMPFLSHRILIGNLKKLTDIGNLTQLIKELLIIYVILFYVKNVNYFF